MPLSPALAAWLRDKGHDAVHVAAIELSAAADSAIIDRAARDNRTIITADLDYPRLLALAQRASPSLILFRDGQWSEASILSRMDALLRTLTEGEIGQSIIVVDHDRVRRRGLPITR